MTSSLIPWSAEAAAETALVCIPWAGAGAGVFRSWGAPIADAASVYGVRLAGRESRQLEPPATSLDEVVGGLTGELAGLAAPRIALFGQCSGALLAFELARALRRAGRGPELTALIVASQLPPRVLAGTPVDDGDDLARFLDPALRDEPELVELLLPVLAADMSLIAGYAYAPEAPLDVPLTVLFGGRDERLDADAVDGWRAETTGPVAVREVAGADHLFGGESWAELAAAVRAALTVKPHGPR